MVESPERLLTQNKDKYLQKLLKIKPWLSACVPNLASLQLSFLLKNYPIDKEEEELHKKMEEDSELREQFEWEVDFIKTNVVPCRNQLRERKTDD